MLITHSIHLSIFLVLIISVESLVVRQHFVMCVCVFLGEAMLPGDEGVWDNYRVKKTLLHSW